MTDKRMLIVDAEVIRRIEENRGDMSYAEFLNFLIDNQLKDKGAGDNHDYVSNTEFQEFTQGMKELLRNFLDFFISYGLELGKKPQDKVFDEISQKLHALDEAERKTPKL